MKPRGRVLLGKEAVLRICICCFSVNLVKSVEDT